MQTLEGHTLARTIILALERMAFVLTEEVDPDEVDENFPLHMKIVIDALDQPAELLVSTSSGFLLEFTANLLGIEEDDEDVGVYSHPAMSELTNVLAEEVFLLLGGSETGFKLSKPLSCPEPEYVRSANQDKAVVTAYLASEGGCLRFCLSPLAG